MRANEFISESTLKHKVADEDYDPNGPPPGPEFKPTMPKGTVRVDVSDVYDWYKLGQHISNMKGLGKHDFGKGPPSTILSFGDEDTEHEYINDLEKTGLTTTDIDPIDPNQPKGMKRQKVDPTFNVNEESDLNEKWSQKYKRSIDCSHPKGFSQRAHCQGRKKNEDTLSEKKRRKAKAKRVYGGYAFYPIAAVDSGEGGDGGGLEEGWKEKLAAAGAAGAMALGGYNYVKQPTQTTQQPQPTAQAQQKTIKPITQKPLEKILYTHAVKAGLSGDELAQFMAQCAHETNDWNSLVEYGGSLDFRKYDPKFAPKKAKILGNTKIGDGARYKGRGYIQLTGRYNYTKASKALGIDLVNKPELAQHPDTAAEIALLFWKNRVRPNVDDFQNTTQVTKKINSGLRGLEDRHENYQDYLRGSGNNKK
jgi:putative chitinase